MPTSEEKPLILPLLGLAWWAAVLVAYYAFNYSYYQEKISAFWKFFLGIIGS